MEKGKRIFKSGQATPTFVSCRFEKGRLCKVFYIPKEKAIKGKSYLLTIDKKESEWMIMEVGQEMSLDIVKNMGFVYMYPKEKE